MRVHERVNAYITEHNIRRSELAEKCSMPLEKLGAIIDGQCIMYAEDLRAICFALNVSAEVFVDFGKLSA